MARQESVIQIKLTTAVIIVIAMMSGASMVIYAMSTLAINLNQNVMGVHQRVMGVHERVNDIKSAVDVQVHMLEEVVGTVLETTDAQQELMQSTSEIQQQVITALGGVNAFLAEHADTPEEVDATE